MGFYAKHVLPRCIDLAMRNRETARLRAEWLPHARGDVLEVGIGSGLNLPFYSSQVRRVYGLDPSAELQRMARGRMTTRTPEVEFFVQSAEAPVPLSDASIDTIVLTWTLCSIANAPAALQQVKRVLKMDASFSRTWPRSRFGRGCLAGPTHARLEANRRWVPPQSQD